MIVLWGSGFLTSAVICNHLKGDEVTFGVIYLSFYSSLSFS